MVSDHAKRHVHLFALAIVGARQLADLVRDVHDRVYFKERIDALTDDGQTLKAHAGVDILLLELGIVVVSVVVKLGEYVVPDLHIPVAVTSDRAARLAAAVFLAAVIVDLRAGTARTRAVLPEVILLAKAENAFGRDADLIMPDVPGLVVVHINRRIQSVRIKADPFRRGQEFPAPGNRFVLEIIAERKVAQHFKIGAVARGMAHVVDVARADALLAGADTPARRLLLPLEPGLHRRHAGVDQQNGFVVLRNQRETRQTKMILCLKEAQKHFSQLIQSVLFHFVLLKCGRKKDTSAPVAGAKVISLYHPDLPHCGLIGASNAGMRLRFPKQARKWLSTAVAGSRTKPVPL